MRNLTIAVTFALLAAAPLLAQSSAKATTAAGLGKADNTSTVDRNIRAYIELLRTDIKTSKSQVLGEVLALDTDQATKFWPIYKEFETEYARLGDRIVAVVLKYADEFDRMTDPVADQLADQVLGIEQERNALKRKFHTKVRQSLGAVFAMRVLQVENQLERIVDLQIAAGLPIIEGR
jgi:hypothetical protein